MFRELSQFLWDLGGEQLFTTELSKSRLHVDELAQTATLCTQPISAVVHSFIHEKDHNENVKSIK